VSSVENAPEPVALLRRVDAYLDAAPDGDATAIDVGPLRGFVSSAPWPFYVRPRPDLDLTGPEAVTVDDVRRAAAVLEAAEQEVSFEWVEQLVPSLGPALVEAGYEVHIYPLLTLDLGASGASRASGARGAPETCSSRARILAGGSPDLRTSLAVSDVGFAAVGTALGPAGVAERDAAAAAVDEAQLEHVTRRVRDGRSVLAVLDDARDGVVATGWHQPIGDTTEVVGVATLPSHRRRGAAAEVVERLLHDARVHGCTLALLTASDDGVARVYERVGFTRIGTSGAAALLDPMR
jgi:GNAT superfamily N-acetyltransferase